jgi:hypothetical protein
MGSGHLILCFSFSFFLQLPVHLDLLDPAQPKLAVKPQNLQREGRIVRYVDDCDDMKYIEPPNASVQKDGCIDETYGRPLCLLLDVLRFLAAKEIVCDETIHSIHDIERIHSGQSDNQENTPSYHNKATTAAVRTLDGNSTTRLNYFLAIAWSHWIDSPKGKGVYEMAKGWVQKEWKRELARRPIPINPVDAKKFVHYREMVDFCGTSFDHIRAVKSWHIRVHGDFWIVSGDEKGSYLIPKNNEDMVYQCVGLTTSLHELVKSKYGKRPMVWKVTLIPYYGRLVYDGVITLGGGFNNASKGLAMAASETKARKLRATVEEAKRNRRVIQRLRQLEVEGGSRIGLSSQGRMNNKAPRKRQQPSPTQQELELLSEYTNMRSVFPPNDPQGVWVFRRKGYTEQENPDRIGLILGCGEPMGFFRCSHGLEPTSIDILQGVVEASLAVGRRPHSILPDDYDCYQRIKFLFQNTVQNHDTSIEYYYPPTPEETAAARATIVEPPAKIDRRRFAV